MFLPNYMVVARKSFSVGITYGICKGFIYILHYIVRKKKFLLELWNFHGLPQKAQNKQMRIKN